MHVDLNHRTKLFIRPYPPNFAVATALRFLISCMRKCLRSGGRLTGL